MKRNGRWYDWLDTERLDKTGEFRVHRNYIESDGQYRFTPYKSVVDQSSNTAHPNDSKGKLIYIGDTPPIAKGITAFFVWDYGGKKCLKFQLEHNLDFDANSYYKFYFDYSFQTTVKENNRLPKPIPVETLKMNDLRKHLADERLRFTESSKYYEECKNENDVTLNAILKKYGDGYFQWLTSRWTNSQTGKTKNMTSVWAYYYHILHQTDPSKRFECDPGGKLKAIERIAQGERISAKNFQQQYNKLYDSKLSEITTARKIPIIEKVIELFKDNPEGLKLAEEYLNKAKGK